MSHPGLWIQLLSLWLTYLPIFRCWKPILRVNRCPKLFAWALLCVLFFYCCLCCREETKALGLISVLTIRLAFFSWPMPHICHIEWWWDLQSFWLSVSGYMILFLSSHLKFFSACFFPPLHLSCLSASIEHCPMTSTQPYLTRFSHFCPFYLLMNQKVRPTLGHVSKRFQSGPLDLQTTTVFKQKLFTSSNIYRGKQENCIVILSLGSACFPWFLFEFGLRLILSEARSTYFSLPS